MIPCAKSRVLSVRKVRKLYLIMLSSFLAGHHAPAASRLSSPGLTAYKKVSKETGD